MNVKSARVDATTARFTQHKNVGPFSFHSEGNTSSNPTGYYKTVKFDMDGRTYYMTLDRNEQNNLRMLLDEREGL